MKLDLVPCPTCAVFGYASQCPECLGHGCIPIDRDLEVPPTEPLGVPANMEVYAAAAYRAIARHIGFDPRRGDPDADC